MSRHKFVAFLHQTPTGATLYCEYCGVKDIENIRGCVPLEHPSVLPKTGTRKESKVSILVNICTSMYMLIYVYV